jgi:hypothetical protein
MKRYRLFLSEIKAATSKRRSENDSACCISNSNQWRVSISRSGVEAQKSRYYFILIRNRILLPKSVSLLVILSPCARGIICLRSSYSRNSKHCMSFFNLNFSCIIFACHFINCFLWMTFMTRELKKNEVREQGCSI